MKILSFLGLGPYDKVTYCWGNRRHTTELFPEALAVWFQHDISEMLVLITEQARNSRYWERLQDRLRGKVQVTPKPIPLLRGDERKLEEELWEIFETLTSCLSQGDEIILDITHTFRSIPILVLLAVAFLRTAGSVNV